MRLSLFAFLVSLACSLNAQLTITITSLPSNTPAGATIYFAGSTNQWNAGDPFAKFVAGANQTWSYTFTPPQGTIEYKLTRGSWPTVESNAAGGFLPNRTVTYSGVPKTVQITVAGWEDQGGGTGGPGSTAASNVSILDNAFPIPQLNRTRRIWLYLPPDYATATNKHYPVLYILDGQNAFDASTSFSGEWQIDEALNARFAAGDYGCIAVAVDNGGAERLNEYSPWVNTQYGGGQGDEFLDFMAETLKPYIDGHYRTNPAQSHTAMIGSSMGGLFAQYALTERQDVYGKAGVFSPAFWFAGNASRDHVLAKGKQTNARVYYLAGGQEPAYVAQDMSAVRQSMQQVGYPVSELFSTVPSDGAHTEWFWRREFPAAYTWLFQGLSTSLDEADGTTRWKIYPNPAQQYVSVKAPRARALDVRIFTTDGRLVTEFRDVRSGDKLPIGDLPNGLYYMHLASDKARAVRSFVKE